MLDRPPRFAATALLPWLLAFPLASCNGVADEPAVGPETLELQLPGGSLDRPAVAYDHGRHTAALAAEGTACTRCHPLAAKPGSAERVWTVVDTQRLDRNQAMDGYHELCLGCHRQRTQAAQKSGPLACGDCHEQRPAARSERAAMRYDYSLHARHSKALKDRCADCHHVLDEATKKLVYKEGTEAGCDDCHGARDEGKKLSLRHASHRACIDCHQQRAAKGQSTGPVACKGCHDPASQAALTKLAPQQLPRLKRKGQPDRALIAIAGSKRVGVPFDHQAHEPRAAFCSACHHQTLKACKECHSLGGKREGGNVRLEQAYHLAGSTHSCVGCHQRAVAARDCAGCHRSITAVPTERSCRRCHLESAASQPLQALAASTEMSPLPAASDAFPEKVRIDVVRNGQDKYQPAQMPHQRIVARLDAAARKSALARQFHGSPTTLCAGCHHHSAADVRPPPCRSCHGAANAPLRDQPRLLAAYHRQCLGCHQKMAIKAGCNDCHAARTRGAR